MCITAFVNWSFCYSTYPHTSFHLLLIQANKMKIVINCLAYELCITPQTADLDIVSVRHPFVLFCSLMLQCGAIDWSQMLVSPVAKVMGSRSSLQFPNLLLESFLTSVACKVNSWPVLLSHNKSIWCSLLFDTAAYEFHLEFGRTVYDSTEIHTENGTKERMLFTSICQEIVSDPDMQDQDMLFSCAPVQCLIILAL